MRKISNKSSNLKPNLLVLNYAMDENSQVFSHQIEVVRKLAKKFNKVYVITTSRGVGSVPENVEVIISKWVQGKRIFNSARFIGIFLRTFIKDRNSVVFSHMTEVQSFLISPITWLFRVKHLIWYAHKSRSLVMTINQFIVNGIITSTSGSCPYKGPKVTAIGQAIDEELFHFKNRKITNPFRFVHVGRIDPSKRLEEIVKSVSAIGSRFEISSLTFVGDSSSHKFADYKNSLLDQIKGEVISSEIEILMPISRKLLPEFLEDFQIFIHAFEGSLDKSIVEATMCGMPVVTLNSEYRKIFGSWSSSNSSNLEEEFFSILNLDEKALRHELMRRYEIAVSQHSLRAWIENVYSLLTK
jgi:glycosyltransferase involved in cell wall biosynthesis